MPHLNVKISQEALDAAKAASQGRGMLLRVWVERLILDATRKPARDSHFDSAETARTLDYTEGQ